MKFPPDAPTAETAGIGLLLRLGPVHYRVFGAGGCEIAPSPPYAAVPGGAEWFLGVVIHKGQALPLVDAAVALDADAPRAARDTGRMLITRCGGLALALQVDDVDADDGREEARSLDLDRLARDLLAAVAAPPPVAS